MAEFENRDRASSFGADAEQYERARPTYPAALVDDLMAGEPRDVVDIGCGTAKAGRLFVERGCRVVGVEPDERMADVARRHLPVVEVAAFEHWDAAGRQFDLAISGQAWHWVEPVGGTAKLLEVLGPGGRVGLFWNLGRHEEGIATTLDEVYDRVAPPGVGELFRRAGTTEQDRALYAPLVTSGGFEPPEIRTYRWEQRYTRAEWLDQLPTHSDHRLLPDAERNRLMDAVGNAIDDFGGSFTMIYDTTMVTTTRLTSQSQRQ